MGRRGQCWKNVSGSSGWSGTAKASSVHVGELDLMVFFIAQRQSEREARGRKMGGYLVIIIRQYTTGLLELRKIGLRSSRNYSYLMASPKISNT